jgi:hypothetical protein
VSTEIHFFLVDALDRPDWAGRIRERRVGKDPSRPFRMLYITFADDELRSGSAGKLKVRSD